MQEISTWQTDVKTLGKYKKHVKVLKTIYEEINSHDLSAINKLVDSILTELDNEYHVLAYVNLINQLEEGLYIHSINVAFLSLILGRWIGYNEDQLRELVLAALLHDVGKMSLPSHISDKDEEDMNFMEKLEYRKHTIYSYEKLVHYNEVNVAVLKGVLSHHERFDGSGYPLGIREERINDIARIIAIADEYDSLKKRYNIFELGTRLDDTMMQKYDVNLINTFCNHISNYYVGCSVVLNTGEVGKVVLIQPKAWGRPIVHVKGKDINLNEKPHLRIVKVI